MSISCVFTVFREMVPWVSRFGPEWGNDVVVPISNWNTLQLRSLIKDISKFYEIPFMEVNAVTGKMLQEAT